MLHTFCLPVGVLQTNCHIVYTDTSDVAAVIDPGDEAQAILHALSDLGLAAGAILLTHGHFDHIGAAEQVSGGRIPVYLHAEDRCMLTSAECNGSVVFGAPPVVSHVNSAPIADGDVIPVGELKFTVLHTPGHSRGSVCYLCGDCLFSGDTMFADGYGRTDLYGGSFDTLRHSLRRVLPYRHSHGIYPGHGEIYREI